MKYLPFFLVLVAVVASSDVERSIQLRKQALLRDIILNPEAFTARQLTAKFNEYVDIVFKNLSSFFSENGYDPLKLDEFHEGFEWKILLITYHGELDLTRGWLHELTTMHRDGDALLKYDALFLHIQIPITFKTLMFNFDYSAKFMNLGPSGGIDGEINDIHIYADVLLDLKELQIYMQDFELQKVGSITLKFTGNILVDWFTNILTKVATTILHKIFVNVLEDKVSLALENIIQEVNNDLHNTFG